MPTETRTTCEKISEACLALNHQVDDLRDLALLVDQLGLDKMANRLFHAARMVEDYTKIIETAYGEQLRADALAAEESFKNTARAAIAATLRETKS